MSNPKPRAVACPTCKAPAGSPCKRPSGYTIPFGIEHAPRLAAARGAAIAAPRKAPAPARAPRVARGPATAAGQDPAGSATRGGSRDPGGATGGELASNSPAARLRAMVDKVRLNLSGAERDRVLLAVLALLVPPKDVPMGWRYEADDLARATASSLRTAQRSLSELYRAGLKVWDVRQLGRELGTFHDSTTTEDRS